MLIPVFDVQRSDVGQRLPCMPYIPDACPASQEFRRAHKKVQEDGTAMVLEYSYLLLAATNLCYVFEMPSQ